MRRFLPIILILASVLFGSLLLDTPAGRAELTTQYTSIGTLDPQLMTANEDIRIGYALFEGLLGIDPYKFVVVPGVAKRFELSDDRLTYTFHLRQNAVWSDGTPVTANDFRFAWRLGLMPDAGCQYIDLLFNIRGAKAFNKWCDQTHKALSKIEGADAKFQAAQKRAAQSIEQFDQMVGVKVLDAHTLEVKLEKPTPYFPELAACWPFFPLPQHSLDPIPVDPSSLMLRRDRQWAKPGRMVNNGPYLLHDWRFKRHIDLRANPNYWNAKEVKLSSIRLICIEDPDAAFRAFHTGTLDLLLSTSVKYRIELVEQSRRNERQDVHLGDGFGTYYYAINCQPTLPNGQANPFRDPAVRRAFALSVDKAQIIKNITRMHQRVARSLVPRDMIDGYESPVGLGYDPAKAHQILADAGYPNGSNLPHIIFRYNTGSNHGAIAEGVAKMWEDHLGVEVTLVGQEWKTYLARMKAGNFMFARLSWFGDYTDPTTFLDMFRTGNGNNHTKFSSAQYDQMMDDAERAPTPAKRMKLLQKAEAFLVEDQVPLIPIYHYKTVHLFDPKRIGGVSLHPRNLQMFHRMEIKR